MTQETLTIQDVARTGEEMNMQTVTATDGFRFQNDGETILAVEEKNGTTAGVGVGTTPTQQVDGLTPATRTVTVSVTSMWVLGPWPPNQYNDADGYLDVSIGEGQAEGVAVLRV